MNRQSEQVDAYLNTLELEQRDSLERLRLFVLGILPGAVETLRAGRVAYDHDCAVLCEVECRAGGLRLHIAEADILSKHGDRFEALGVQSGYIPFRCFEDLPLGALALVLKEAARRGEHPWLEKLGDCLAQWAGTQSHVLCIGVAAESIRAIALIAERETGASLLREVAWIQGDLDLAYQEKPDLIVLDFDARSQGRDGWETLAQIRSAPDLQTVPVLALFDSRTLRRDRPLFASLGGPFAEACLFIPFSPDDLARALCEALG